MLDQYFSDENKVVFESEYAKVVSIVDKRWGEYDMFIRTPTVVVIAENSLGGILLIKEIKYDENNWHFPSGKVKPSDISLEAAANRELKEETGYVASDMKLVFKNSTGKKWIWNTYVFWAKGLTLLESSPDFDEDINHKGFYTKEEVKKFIVYEKVLPELASFAYLKELLAI
jgi:8-oxo-dGTP pyrophosphatase MutT (NUDIX family)